MISVSIIFTQNLYKHLPQQRKLSKEAKENALSLLSMKANKKMVQEELSQKTGNVILLKDLTKLCSRAKKETTRNNLEAVVKVLKEKYVEINSKCQLPWQLKQ